MPEPVPVRAGAGSSAPPAPPAPDASPKGAGGTLKSALTRKIGPLPAWGWAVVIGGAGLGYRLLRGDSVTRQEVPTTNITPGASPAAGYLNELSVALKRIEDSISALPDTLARAVTGETAPGSAPGGTATTSPTSGTAPSTSTSPTSSPTTQSTATSSPISAKSTAPIVGSTLLSAERTLTRAVQQVAQPVRPVSSGRPSTPNTVIQREAPQLIPGPTAGTLRTTDAVLREEMQAMQSRVGRVIPSVPVPRPAPTPAPKPSPVVRYTAPVTTRARQGIAAVYNGAKRVVAPAPKPTPKPAPKRRPGGGNKAQIR